MKKFALTVLSMLALSTVFIFGCDSPDKDNERPDKQITYTAPEKDNFSRAPHLKRNGGVIPHMPIHTAPKIKDFPRK